MRAPTTAAPALGCGVAGPKSGAHPGGRHLRRQTFELAAADVFQVLAQRVGGRFFVKINRDLKTGRDFAAHFPGERHAISHRRAFDRHERHDVHRTHTRMLTAMRAEIDVRDGSFEQGQHRMLHAVRIADEREHRSIVRRIRGVIEQVHAVDRSDRRRHRRHDLRTSSLTHVRNAFDEHRELDSSAVHPQIAML